MNIKNPKIILFSAFGVAVGWMFASNLQAILDSLFPSISPIVWVLIASSLAIFGFVRLR